jgi:hypothetical protein
MPSNAARRRWKERNLERVRAINKDWERRNPDKMKAKWRRHYLKKHYNTTPEIVAAEQAKQGNKCAICRVRLTRPAVDHDHKKKKFRSVLCSNCNIGIGQFKESPARMLAAIVYLQRHKCQHT